MFCQSSLLRPYINLTDKYSSSWFRLDRSALLVISYLFPTFFSWPLFFRLESIYCRSGPLISLSCLEISEVDVIWNTKNILLIHRKISHEKDSRLAYVMDSQMDELRAFSVSCPGTLCNNTLFRLLLFSRSVKATAHCTISVVRLTDCGSEIKQRYITSLFKIHSPKSYSVQWPYIFAS